MMSRLRSKGGRPLMARFAVHEVTVAGSSRVHPVLEGVEDDLDSLAHRRCVDRTENRLRVVDVDVAHERKAEQRHRLLAMDERDHRHASRARDLLQADASTADEEVPLHRGLQRREDEEEPQQAERIYGRARAR